MRCVCLSFSFFLCACQNRRSHVHFDVPIKKNFHIRPLMLLFFSLLGCCCFCCQLIIMNLILIKNDAGSHEIKTATHFCVKHFINSTGWGSVFTYMCAAHHLCKPHRILWGFVFELALPPPPRTVNKCALPTDVRRIEPWFKLLYEREKNCWYFHCTTVFKVLWFMRW